MSLTSRTVAVLGASYGGANVAQALANALPENWRVVVIDRNSHMNHLYVFNRYSVVSGHEPKAFIPYKRLFWQRNQEGIHPPKSEGHHLFLQATVTGIDSHSLTLSKAFPGAEAPEQKLPFDYLVYALGSHLPEPIDLWGSASLGSVKYDGTKPKGIEFLKSAQKQVEAAPSVLVVGGGALGIQYATDIADAYPDKRVTILHSRDRLLPKFHPSMHEQIIQRMSDLGVNVILGERLDLSSVPASALNTTEEHVLRTAAGREIRAALVLLCTGQKPNTELLRNLLSDSIIADGPNKGYLRVNRALQVVAPSAGNPDDAAAPHEHIFAIGDAADAFGAIKAGHNALAQGNVAAENILKLIRRQEGGVSEPLQSYTPGPPGIKVSVGLDRALFQRGPRVAMMADQPLDWGAAHMWRAYGYPNMQEIDIYD